jgi:uncharacterized caspase-like protein
MWRKRGLRRRDEDEVKQKPAKTPYHVAEIRGRDTGRKMESADNEAEHKRRSAKFSGVL